MGTFLGIIEKVGYKPSVWYNFRPIYEVKNRKLVQLSIEDLSLILPDSYKRNVNFSYNWNIDEQTEFMESNFPDKSLVVFDFETSDLMDNFNAQGDRNQTGYKVLTTKMYENLKIRPADKDGIYLIIDSKDVTSNFLNDRIVEVEAMGLCVGRDVLVDRGDFYAGPYDIGFRLFDKAHYIQPQIKENKYVIYGYRSDKCEVYTISLDNIFMGTIDNKIRITLPLELSHKDSIDIISDSALIESFKESIDDKSVENGKIAIENIQEMISHYENSFLVGSGIQPEIRKNRMNRLTEILTSEADLDDTLSYISESLCDLLIKYRDTPNVNELIQNLITTQEDFLDKIQSIRIIKEQIENLEQKRDAIKQDFASIEGELNQKYDQAKSIEQTAIEEKKKELLAMDGKYAESKAELDNIIGRLKIARDIETQNRALEAAKKDALYWEAHKSHLENDSRNLETEFLDRINNYHDRMVGISFDGFLSSKMLSAAAKWEQNEDTNKFASFVKSLNEVVAAEKSPEQLIQYLCESVQKERPNYNKNTIVNIFTCLMNGFLTVFSGDPGSGKTSICNIMSEVLGLNKFGEMQDLCSMDLKRYIPISVERGWTSKRDLIGYYNPLSKQFDKSNQRIFSALKLLDLEKREGIAKYPFIILLDEANLSPMEYYWADFMNVCDNLDGNSQINLGEDYIFRIPETLHFIATINNDHTTETLSPRLIDRAWIITLPHNASLSYGIKIPSDEIETISWNSLKTAFLPDKTCVPMMTAEAQKIYEMSLIPHLKKARILLSPRTEIAIKRYWNIASKFMEKDDYGNDPSIVALDYAVAQKILPKITGSGDEYSKWIDELRTICNNNNLNVSATKVKEIFERGNDQMKYYQFFG